MSTAPQVVPNPPYLPEPQIPNAFVPFNLLLYIPQILKGKYLTQSLLFSAAFSALAEFEAKQQALRGVRPLVAPREEFCVAFVDGEIALSKRIHRTSDPERFEVSSRPPVAQLMQSGSRKTTGEGISDELFSCCCGNASPADKQIINDGAATLRRLSYFRRVKW